MQDVRDRDRRCRFPGCPCHEFNLRLDVSHARHRGIGGNPAGDRTDPASMVLLCLERHQGTISVDAVVLAWEPLDARLGADGRIAWYLCRGAAEPLLLASEQPGGQSWTYGGPAAVAYLGTVADRLRARWGSGA